MDVVTRYDIPVFEDNPYGDLRFEGEEIAPLISMDPKRLVIYSGTFSKTPQELLNEEETEETESVDATEGVEAAAGVDATESTVSEDSTEE